MIALTAPEGHEALVCYNDGSRAWDVSVREVGDTWWKIIASAVGHAHMKREDVIERAEGYVRRYFATGNAYHEVGE